MTSSHISRMACGSMHSVALIGDSSQVSTLSPNYYANNDVLTNSWMCDMRGLSLNARGDRSFLNFDLDIPDDGDGRIKNPK